MKEAKTGLVVVASEFESGGQRAEELISDAEKALAAKGITAAAVKKTVWNAADAVAACEELKGQDIDSLTIILSTWVTDSLLYIFINQLKVPVVFWAVPYTETFSIGCIQHFGAALTTHHISFEYVYGLAKDEKVVDKVVTVAEAGRIIKSVKDMKLALVGPRQTWRVAGPQDTTNEEWEFSEKFGVTIIHIEMEEIIEAAKKIPEDEVVKKWKCLKKRTGKVLADEEAMLHLTSIYLAVKETVETYKLDALAAECYPYYSGLMNLPSSWLADEGIILDTEGDIGHTVVMYMLNQAAKGGATALGEVGSMDDVNNILCLAHEGSTAHSLAASLDQVQISPSGNRGSFVGLPLKPMDVVTYSSIQGNGIDGYKILVANGNVVEATHEEWVEGGEKLLVKLGVNCSASGVVDQMIANGMDHHILVKEGDYAEVLSLICKFMKVQAVTVE